MLLWHNKIKFQPQHHFCTLS